MVKKLNPKLVRLIDILNDGNFHDGTTLGEQLKISRSAVWKLIQKLENDGVSIQSVKGKGYLLMKPFTLLNAEKIQAAFANFKCEIVVFETIHSTNHYLKSFKHSSSIRFCLAEQQTDGKGRLNRQWVSPFGKNIYLSCLYPFRKDVSELSGLSLVMSLAVIKTLKSFGISERLHVKWPNDILYDKKKLSGSLIEIQAETHGCCQAIIGIGINVNMQPEDVQSIMQPWTAMQMILQKEVDRNEVCIRLIGNMLDYLQQFCDQGLSSFMLEWKQADGLLHQSIVLKNINDSIMGKVMGINEQGHLLLQLENGVCRAYSSGDATVSKMSS